MPRFASSRFTAPVTIELPYHESQKRRGPPLCLFQRYPLWRRLLSALVTGVVIFVVGLAAMRYYCSESIDMENPFNAITIHRDRPDTDFCYSVVDVDRWYNNETVLGSRARHTTWGQELEERLREAGEPVCYCRRYFVRDLEPGMAYTARTAYVGPATGSVPLATSLIRRGRIEAILSGKDGQLLMDPEDVPPEYLIDPKELVKRNSLKPLPMISEPWIKNKTVYDEYNTTRYDILYSKEPHFPNVKPMYKASKSRASSKIAPTDAITHVLIMDKAFKFRMFRAQEMTAFDFVDVPEWTQSPNVSFFDWKATLHPVSWSTLHFAQMLGIGSEIISYVWQPGLRWEDVPRDEWLYYPARPDLEVQIEEDPFVPLIEVCGEYNPFSTSPLVDPVREYNFIVSKSPMGVPEYGPSIITLLAAVFGLGQFFLFSPWF